MIQIEDLEQAIHHNDIDEVEEILAVIVHTDKKDAVPNLITYLRNTENSIIRNALAIALSDMRDERAIEPIVELLEDPKTLGNRGTLLYALEPFDCTSHLETLVRQFLTGNFEVQAGAYQLIESMGATIPVTQLNKALIQIEKQLMELKRQQQLHEELSELLENLKRD